MNYKSLLTQSLINIDELKSLSFNEIESFVSAIKEDEKGDYTLTTFIIAKNLGLNPMELAANIANAIKLDNAVFDKVENKGGYVNFFVNKKILSRNVANEILSNDKNFFTEDIGQGKVIAIDFSSVNLAKHFHIGHMRNTILGAAFSRVFNAFGYDVKRLNYLGDYGIQYGKMIALAKRKNIELSSSDVSTMQTLYAESVEIYDTDDTFKAEAQSTFLKLGAGDKEILSLYQKIKSTTLKETEEIFKEFDITFDSYNGEYYYEQFIPDVLKKLDKLKISKVSEGATIVDLTDYGLNISVLVSSAGYTLYPTRDLAAAIERGKEYNFEKLLYITASEQIPHFAAVIKILDLMGEPVAPKLKHVFYGRYSLEDGKLSSRMGAKALLKDILSEAKLRAKNVILEKGKVDEHEIDNLAAKIGKGALVYSALCTTRGKDIVFNLDRTLQFDGETGPYLQYVLARINSIFNKLENAQIKFNPELATPEEIKIYKLLFNFKDACFSVMKDYEPSYLTKYLIDLAKAFNKFYTEHHIANEDINLQSSRLATCQCVKLAFNYGFNLLGIPIVEKM